MVSKKEITSSIAPNCGCVNGSIPIHPCPYESYGVWCNCCKPCYKLCVKIFTEREVMDPACARLNNLLDGWKCEYDSLEYQNGTPKVYLSNTSKRIIDDYMARLRNNINQLGDLIMELKI